MPQRVHNNGRSLSIKVDIDTCTACQLCYDRLPSVFVDRGDGIPLVMVKVPVEEVYEELLQVAEDCPSNSIILAWTG
ncbi:MAG: ferredoxin [Aquificaceae bacterium]|nr:ferredoxin [Aquificaceae bacterium]MCS7195946.1 ferredoxin [Aquificaceae bacterium]MCX7990200.1 ferredoxin [Aquificaceae bacterium]MDW8033319.1 ferredoxin [Aquificaceae bacterium]